jgi:hypothetical protein
MGDGEEEPLPPLPPSKERLLPPAFSEPGGIRRPYEVIIPRSTGERCLFRPLSILEMNRSLCVVLWYVFLVCQELLYVAI